MPRVPKLWLEDLLAREVLAFIAAHKHGRAPDDDRPQPIQRHIVPVEVTPGPAAGVPFAAPVGLSRVG